MTPDSYSRKAVGSPGGGWDGRGCLLHRFQTKAVCPTDRGRPQALNWLTVELILFGNDAVPATPGAEIRGVVERLLFEVTEDPDILAEVGVGCQDTPGFQDRIGGGREAVVGLVVVVDAQADLLQVVHALHAPCSLARRLNGRQQQRDQYRDNRDDNEQFDQCETSPKRHHKSLRCLAACTRQKKQARLRCWYPGARQRQEDVGGRCADNSAKWPLLNTILTSGDRSSSHSTLFRSS